MVELGAIISNSQLLVHPFRKLAQHHVGAVISKTSNSKGGRRTASSAAKDIIMSDEDYRYMCFTW